MNHSLQKKILSCFLMLIACINVREATAASISDESTAAVYTSGQTFSSLTPISAIVDAGGTIAAFTVAANTTLKFICSNALTITTLTLGKNAKVQFTGKSQATVTNVNLDTTGQATLGFAKGGLTITNQPANMSLLSVFEFLGDGATLTCNNGAAWLCELRMTSDGIFASSSATTLAGLISGPGAVTLPASCSTVTSTGSNRGAKNDSVVFGTDTSIASCTILSSGILNLSYNLTYTGAVVVQPITKGAPIVIQHQKLPCSAVILAASVMINGGNGLEILKLTDTNAFYPTLQGTLTVNTYNPLGNSMIVNSGSITVKAMTQPDGTFSIHKASGAILKIGG